MAATRVISISILICIVATGEDFTAAKFPLILPTRRPLACYVRRSALRTAARVSVIASRLGLECCA